MSSVNPPARHPQGHPNLYPERDLTPQQQADRARKDRKVFRVNPDQLGEAREYGWRCRVCPGYPMQRGFSSGEKAAADFDISHAPTETHQRFLRERALINDVVRALEETNGPHP